MNTVIVGGTLLTPEKELRHHSLILADGKIAAIQPDAPVSPGDRVVDAQGLWVTPGLIDIHVHGSLGSDTMDATPAALEAMGRFFATHGVTSYLATTITTPGAAIQAALANVAACMPGKGGAQLLGAHLEGPYLSADYKGAQPLEYLRLPDSGEYGPWLQDACVRLITLAPELEGASDLIRRGAERGIRIAAGHTAADYETLVAAADLGLRQATHTFNGMLGLHHRRPGAAGAVLTDDRIYAQLIVDGVHLHPAIVKLVFRTKGVGRTILITDAMRAAGLEDGEYDLGGQTVVVAAGVARAPNGSLAGSTLTLNAALRNAIQFTGLSLPEVLPAATSVPAQAMGLEGRKGVLAPGADADITLFDDQLAVQKTMVAGELVYEKL